MNYNLAMTKYQVVETLINPPELSEKDHIHRVYVVDEQQKPILVISISDVLSHFKFYEEKH